jgi:hypothetical protein
LKKQKQKGDKNMLTEDIDIIIAVYNMENEKIMCKFRVKEKGKKLIIEVDEDPETWLPQVLAALTEGRLGDDYREVLENLDDGDMYEWGTWYDEKGREFKGSLIRIGP